MDMERNPKIGFTETKIGADFDFLNCVGSPKVSCKTGTVAKSSSVVLQVPGIEREAVPTNVAQTPAACDGQC